MVLKVREVCSWSPTAVSGFWFYGLLSVWSSSCPWRNQRRQQAVTLSRSNDSSLSVVQSNELFHCLRSTKDIRLILFKSVTTGKKKYDKVVNVKSCSKLYIFFSIKCWIPEQTQYQVKCCCTACYNGPSWARAGIQTASTGFDEVSCHDVSLHWSSAHLGAPFASNNSTLRVKKKKKKNWLPH